MSLIGDMGCNLEGLFTFIMKVSAPIETEMLYALGLAVNNEK